jgi:serine/threonine protein kinase
MDDNNNNMNITRINGLNKVNLSLNLIKEEEEKISTKDFICLALLGRGSFGEVYLVQKISNKKNYAMKILRKERIMGQNLSKYAIAERNVLSLSNHPFIVKLNFAFQTLTKLFLILEYCPGGDLSRHLSYEKKFDEKRAKFYLCEILLALEDLHKRNIIFRDLKPENVVLDEEGHCKLTDFGLSKEGIDNDQYTKSFCGSIAYLAPEVLKKQGHGKAVDWYLLGVLLYEMLTGVTPYYDKNKNNLFYNIEQGKLIIPNFVSENAKSLLRGLLQRDPKRRLGGGNRDSEEIKEHKFFEDVDWQKIYEKKIEPPKALKINNNMYLFNKPKYFADENNLEEIFGDNSLKGWTFINKDDM